MESKPLIVGVDAGQAPLPNPALPLTLQLKVPVGAVAPVAPVIVALKVRVDPSAPPPLPVRTRGERTFAMVIVPEVIAVGAL